MAIVQIKNLSFSYYGYSKEVFSNVSFSFDTNWKTGLIGRNGTGKSTLFRLLAEEERYEGKIEKSVHFLKFPFLITDDSQLGWELFHEKMPEVEDWKFLRELNLLKVEKELICRPFCTLSQGEQTKVLLAMLFAEDDGFLLMDEPTNHLDVFGRELVGEYLKNKKGFLLISHDRSFLDCCVDHIIAFNRTSIEVQSGNFSSWNENKKKREQFEIQENERLKKDITRLKTAAKQSKNWSDRIEKTKNGQKISGVKPDKGYIGHQAAKMMQKAKNLEKRQQRAIEEKEKLRKDIEVVESLRIPVLQYPQKVLVRGENLSVFFGERQVLKNINFEVSQKDRIAICGKNGSGKSTFLKLLKGEDISYRGELFLGSGLKISYLPQDTKHLRGKLREYFKTCSVEETLCKTILRKLDFARELFDMEMESYSEGQKKKVLLAVSLAKPAHLFLWDEPLNYMDIISRMQIEELILETKPTLLFVEHEKAFRDKVATKVIQL